MISVTMVFIILSVIFHIFFFYQMDIIELLLKTCDSMEQYAKKVIFLYFLDPFVSIHLFSTETNPFLNLIVSVGFLAVQEIGV